MSTTNATALKTHWFRLTVEGLDDWTDELVGRMLAAGCDDSSLGTCGGVHEAAFAREALSYDEAVASARAAVEGLGLTVVRVEVEEPPTTG